MRVNTTRIEELDARHEGLALAVDAMLDEHSSLGAIQAEIERRTGQRIPAKTISNYKQRRWLPEVERIREVSEKAAAIRRAFERYGIGPTAEGIAAEKLDAMDPEFLLRESRQRARLELEKRKLEISQQAVDIDKQRLALEIGKLEGERRKVKDVIDGASDGKKDANESIRRIREIYGIE